MSFVVAVVVVRIVGVVIVVAGLQLSKSSSFVGLSAVQKIAITSSL